MTIRPYCKEIEEVTQKIQEATQALNSQVIKIRIIINQLPRLEEDRRLWESMKGLRSRIDSLCRSLGNTMERG
jgi:chromosome segregation ATPase